jgi:hypothetical protein
MNSRAIRAASDESDFKLAEGERPRRHAGSSIRHLVTFVREGRHPVQDAGSPCRSPGSLREAPADFSQRARRDAGSPEALFCIKNLFTDDSAEFFRGRSLLICIKKALLRSWHKLICSRRTFSGSRLGLTDDSGRLFCSKTNPPALSAGLP